MAPMGTGDGYEDWQDQDLFTWQQIVANIFEGKSETDENVAA